MPITWLCPRFVCVDDHSYIRVHPAVKAEGMVVKHRYHHHSLHWAITPVGTRPGSSVLTC